MSTHPHLHTEAIEDLRDALGVAAPADDVPGAGTEAESVPARRTARSRAKTAIRRMARPVVAPLLDATAEHAARRLRDALGTEHDRLATEVELIRAQLDSLLPVVDAIDGLGGVAGLVAASGAGALADVHALTINQELMKGELRAFHKTMEDLGRAISPGAGIDDVPRQFAELRAQLNALDRRLRARPGTTTTAAAAGPVPSAGPGFDYVGFEHRFRGDPAEILARTEARYLSLLTANQPVLDVGCGRGELLAGLAARGVRGVGVDVDADMIAEARARGVEAHIGDALAFLRAAPEGSYGSICAIQLVEHLHIGQVVELLDLAATRLRPGGLLIAETPNPTSMIVLARSYILDPTHVWPLHPSLLTFLSERAGFREVEERFFGPAEELYLPMIDAGDESPPWVGTVNQAFGQLNQILFGPQDYAVVARTRD